MWITHPCCLFELLFWTAAVLHGCSVGVGPPLSDVLATYRGEQETVSLFKSVF